ncbi:MAG: efflux RND transporter permease subunit [Planctomycetes bacterium]|nr:efflux RND transporter permease subunit [Planctomycetota bacterium]MBI3835580.1 efflux RND transporter permease subunit [Planctomycetota bacterium]
MFATIFIDRPVFASVISIVIVLLGVVAINSLPIAQYPEIVPPTIQVSAMYPGANAKVVADTVATPIEQEVNGVENMLYMFSKSTNDGQMYLDVTFNVGTDLNMAQVLTQNRVAIAEAKLPEEVKRQGVTTKKKSPAILLCINLISPDNRYDQLYLSNYATIQVKDAISRLTGIGDVTFLGARDYSMRIWLDPEKLASRGLTASDVTNALREQNVQVAAGRLGQPPAPAGQAFQLTINTLGRLMEPEQFADIIIKTGSQGQVTRIRDIGRTELGAKNYDVNSFLDGKPCITLAVFQLPGSNAIATADGVKAKMEELQARFPEGLQYKIVYDTTVFIDESIHEVYKTLFEAFVLVFIVVLWFLQSWRACLIPMVAVPVSLIGTCAVMAMLGFSLNNLSLFGLVLAIGIVVDDAIVVVESVELHMSQGLSPREATRKSMLELWVALIAIAAGLSSVFIPCAFISGISGQFYRQFALTIAVATLISAFNSLTLSPALCALLLKPHVHGEGKHSYREVLPRFGIITLAGLIAYWVLPKYIAPIFGVEWSAASGHGESEVEVHKIAPLTLWGIRAAAFVIGGVAGFLISGIINHVLDVFFRGFNWFFDRLVAAYGAVVGAVLRVGVIMLVIYVGLIYLSYRGFMTVPVGFIPEQDKGYLVVNTQLPDGASLERTEAVVSRLAQMAGDTPGVAHTIAVPGYSILSSTNIPNLGGMFVILAPFEERKTNPALSGPRIAAELRRKFVGVQEAVVAVFGAPPVDGLGNTGGFKMQIQDRADAGIAPLQEGVESVVSTGNAQPGLIGLFSSFRANQPQIFVDLNRTQAKSLSVALTDIFDTLQTYLGSVYANDFTRFGRNWQVNVQAESKFRLEPDDITRLKVRSANGQMVPLGAVVAVKESAGPAIVNHYNMYPSAEINGGSAPNISSGQAISMMENVSDRELPSTMGYEWTELALQQKLAGNTAIFVFILGAVLVFLVHSAEYESWSLSLSIIMIVPMCMLPAIGGIWLMGMDNNIFTQIGLVVLIGLAAKNAVLIVEFSKHQQDKGLGRREATIEACKQRLRPILMTSFAFTLGVLPLVLAKGAGAEMRVALGVAVFAGMLGVTAFGIFFTPVFYSTIRWITERKGGGHEPGGHDAPPKAEGGNA